jgi:hypothetical protein
MIITEELIKEAIDLVSPSAEAIFAAEGTGWGPKWVDGFVAAPGLGDIPFRFGEATEWNPVWGDQPDFPAIAAQKLRLAKRLGEDTSRIVAVRPWQLEPGEYLYEGGVSRFGISAATSGAKGRTDEALADILVSTIIMLAHLETDRRLAAHHPRI